MTGEDIPDADSVVRYIGGSKIADGVVLGEAFRLPAENPERDSLSVNWRDYFRGLSKAERLSDVRRLSFRPNGRLAELQVGATREYLRQELNALRLVKTPLDANPPSLRNRANHIISRHKKLATTGRRCSKPS